MTASFPETGSETDWNAAYYRLEDYFRSLRIANKVYQNQIIMKVLEKAAQRHASDPTQNPTTLCMEEASSEMERWFSAILGKRERIGVTGLISLLAVDAPARFPNAFLAEEVPVELLEEMRKSEISAGPDLQVSSMVPRPIDVGPLLEPVVPADALAKAPMALAVLAVAGLTAVGLSIFFMAR